MRDVAALEGERATVDVFQTSDQAQQGGLAAARRANENDELAWFDFQIDALDGTVVTEEFFDALELQISHGVCLKKVCLAMRQIGSDV
jgi:hypothetical protein